LRDLQQQAARYEFIRTLTPAEFATLYAQNLKGRGTFDELVDEAIKENA
jgi:hypothetical protein